MNSFQVRVKYSKTPFRNDSSDSFYGIPESDWENLKRIDMKEKEEHDDTPLLVNIKGNRYQEL